MEKHPSVVNEERNRPCDIEVYVMKSMKSKNAQHCPIYKTYGCNGDNRNYIVMEIVGENLLRLKSATPLGRFSLATCLHVGRQSLMCVEELHRAG